MSKLPVLVITGGAGFMGSHFVDYALQNIPLSELRILDKLTYAADIQNLNEAFKDRRVKFIDGDVSRLADCNAVAEGASTVVHFAAESHVGASFIDPVIFMKSNTLGTHSMLEAAHRHKVETFIHISTDEVYGEVLDGVVDESAPFFPTTPYSASKAAAEMVANSYRNTYNMDVRIIRSNNVMGVRQFPEKIMPKFICQSLLDFPMTIHGSGMQKRTFVAVDDFCRAVHAVIEKGEASGTYNVGTNEEYSVNDVAAKISTYFAASQIKHIKDHIFNDHRYGVCYAKLRALGWSPQKTINDIIPAMIDWYRARPEKLQAFRKRYDATMKLPQASLAHDVPEMFQLKAKSSGGFVYPDSSVMMKIGIDETFWINSYLSHEENQRGFDSL